MSEIKNENKTPENTKRLPSLLRLTRRACVFLFLLSGAFFMFYVSGSYQKFLDSNIRLILNAAAFTGITTCFFSGLAIIETVFFAIKDKKPVYLFNLFFFIIYLAWGTGITLSTLFINSLSEGINF